MDFARIGITTMFGTVDGIDPTPTPGAKGQCFIDPFKKL